MARRRLIQLKNFSKPIKGAQFTDQTYYSVHLNKGHFIQFKDLADVNLFLAYTNEFLNLRIDILMLISAQVYINFTSIFRYMSDNECKLILGNYSEINRCINLALDRHQLRNGNSFCFFHLENATSMLHKTIGQIRLHTRAGDTVSITLQAYENQLNQISKELESFPTPDQIDQVKTRLRSRIRIKIPSV